MLALTKRQKITITTTFLGVGLFILPGLAPKYQLYSLVTLVALSYLLSLWSLYQDVTGIEFVSLFVLPVVLAGSFGLFVYQFDPNFVLRLLLSATFALVFYTILLAENIFNVSAERNIPLLRAANTVGYLTSLFVSFAFFSLLFSLGIDGYIFTATTFAVGFLLFLQALWQIKLEETHLPSLLRNSFVASLILAEFSWILTFWPLPPAQVGLAIAAMVYVLLGIMQHLEKGDLSTRSLIEYLLVALSIFLLLAVTTSWGG